MSAQARTGDTGQGICYGHLLPTPFTTIFTDQGSATSIPCNGKSSCIIGTKGNASCGHTTTATTGSAVTFKQGKGAHRIGDSGVSDAGGTYTVVSGSPDTFIE